MDPNLGASPTRESRDDHDSSSASLPHRDALVDADASLTRKRQRTSDGPSPTQHCDHTSVALLTPSSPLSSPAKSDAADDVNIQIVDEEIVADAEPVNIIMDDDPLPGNGSSPGTFPCYKNENTVEAAAYMVAECFSKDHSLDSNVVKAFNDWMSQGPWTILEPPGESEIHGYIQHNQFWQNIGLCFQQLGRGTRSGDKYGYRGGKLQDVFAEMLRAYSALCTRLVRAELYALERSLTRRDSAKPEEWPVYKPLFLDCIGILKFLLDDAPLWHVLHERNKSAFDANVMQRMAAQHFVAFSEDAEPILRLFETLVTRPGQVQHVFPITRIYNLLLCNVLILAGHIPNFLDSRPVFLKNVAKIFHVSSTVLFPQLCKTNPRELPHGVHRGVFYALEVVLSAMMTASQGFASSQFAHIVEPIVKDDEEIALGRYRNLTKGTVVKGFMISGAKAFLTSGFIDIQATGLDILNNALSNSCYESTRPSHPITEFMARCLETNKVVDFILGPDSHPDVLRRSAPTVVFLAKSGHLTKAIIDSMWAKATLSIQADIIEAAFFMLGTTILDMNRDQVCYIISKYNALPLQHLGKHALGLLEHAVKCVSFKKEHETKPDIQCQVASALVTLLQQLSANKRLHDVQHAQNMHSILVASLRTILEPSADLNILIKLVQHCASQIGVESPAATGSLCALLVCFQVVDQKAASDLVQILPLDSAVRELRQYVQSQKALASTVCDRIGLDARIQVIMHKIGFNDTTDNAQRQEQVWHLLVGDQAINNDCRQFALAILVSHFRQKPALQGFLVRCINQYLPTLPEQYATAELASLFSVAAALCNDSETAPCPSVQILNQLMRLLLTVPDGRLASHLAASVMNYAFHEGALVLTHIAIPVQVKMARTCIDALEGTDLVSARGVQMLVDLIRESTTYDQKTIARPGSTSFGTVTVGGIGSHAPFQVSVEAHGWPDPIIVFALEINDSSSLKDVQVAIQGATGYRAFRAYTSGQKLDLDWSSDRLASECGLVFTGKLLVHKDHSLESLLRDRETMLGKTAIEKEVLKNFERLYLHLEDNSEQGLKVCKLLARLDAPAYICVEVIGDECANEQRFPIDKPWKTMYSVHVLHAMLNDQLRVGVVDATFMSHSVRVLVDLLLRDDALAHVTLQSTITSTLIDFLRERPPGDDHTDYFEHPNAILRRLYDMMHDLDQRSATDAHALRGPYEHLGLARAAHTCLMEAVRRSPNIRSMLLTDQTFAERHKHLVISTNEDLSQAVVEGLTRVCGDEDVPANVKAWCWSLIFEALPIALAQPQTCGPFFNSAPEILRSDLTLTSDKAKMRMLTTDLVGMLLKVDHEEQFDSDLVDSRIRGLCLLLQHCVACLKSFKESLSLGSLATDIFDTFLFPPSSFFQSRKPPIMTESTRQGMYDLILALCENGNTYHKLVQRVSDTLQDSHLSTDNYYPGRSDFLRASCGFVGLENLGQTCYLNSLLQQLFMNVSFRKFVLQTPIQNAKQQRVLAELQNTFAHLQGSYGSEYCPKELAQALDVDIGSQEDAHIFFTTLIGKLEDNMATDHDRKRLRSFFGGRNRSQTVGQCGHVSESTDEYYNLSLVVKDKAGLTESLQEYVEGAPLEGGDKFKCLTCESEGKEAYVNAMRRTGLEHIPDNLVLGLKRFRYETWDGGTKVNDRFDFPSMIDMSPFKLENLGDNKPTMEEDLFELVGTIVHQGTLQFGHYWCYAKEQDPRGQDTERWYRLEDSRATPAQLSAIMRDCCGGLVKSNNGFLIDRTDSAYILLYKRTASNKQRLSPEVGSSASPSARTMSHADSIPRDLRNDLVKANDNIVRIVHLFDPAHTTFVKDLILQGDSRAESYNAIVSRNAEDPSLVMAWQHYLEIVIQRNSLDHLSEYTSALLKLALRNSESVRYVVGELVSEKLSSTLVFHGKPLVRKTINDLMMSCLKFTREHIPELYGTDRDHSDLRSSMIWLVVQHYTQFRDALANNRIAWPQYFDQMVRIAALGPVETKLVLDTGLLYWCIMIVYMKHHPMCRHEMSDIWGHMQNGRHYSIVSVVDCIAGLLSSHVDLRKLYFAGQESTNDHVLSRSGCLLNHHEALWLTLEEPRGTAAIVENACLWVKPNPSHPWQDWAPGRLMSVLTGKTMEPEYARLYSNSLMRCLRGDSDYHSLVVPAIHCCFGTADATAKADMVQAIAGLTNGWYDIGHEIIFFMETVFPVLGSVVLDNTPAWALDIISGEGEEVDESQVIEWLDKHIFKQDVIGTPQDIPTAVLDVARLTATKALLRGCKKPLIDACRGGDDRDAYQTYFDIVGRCLEYMKKCKKLLETIDAIDDDEDEAEDGNDNGDDDDGIEEAEAETGQDEAKIAGGALRALSTPGKPAHGLRITEDFRRHAEDLHRMIASGETLLDELSHWGEELDEVDEEDEVVVQGRSLHGIAASRDDQVVDVDSGSEEEEESEQDRWNNDDSGNEV